MALLSNERKAYRLSLLFGILFLLVGAYLFRLQVVDTQIYQNLSEKNRIRVIYLEAPRGSIIDREGRVLASNRLSFSCSAFPVESKTNIHQTLASLSLLLGEDVETLRKRYYKGKPGVYKTIVLAEDILPEQAMAIEERLDSLPGILIETRPVRIYPFKESSAHILGYIGPITDEEEEDLEGEGYLASDWIGRDGLEKSYESNLHGRPGGIQMEVNSRGRFVRALGVREPADGQNLQLTVDALLQEFVQKELQGQKGAVIVMSLEDGGILSMNSSPSFNPNLFASTKSRRDLGTVLTDADAPMINRAIRSQFPPGSIFKIITAMAALGTSRVTEFSSFQCSGSLMVGNNIFHCWKESGHGPQVMAEAFAHSCNVYFYSTGLLAGIDAIYRQAIDFGLGHATGIDLPGEREGFVPNRDWKRKKFGTGWYEGETANLSIGQGSLQLTPIQALEMVSTAATSGIRLKPHLVSRLDGEALSQGPVSLLRRDPRYWKAIKEGLYQVINSDSGTGRLSRVPGLSIAGKTGTAQSGQDKTHAWFVGYAPARDPKIAMVVFLEQGGRGGIAAATMASKIFKELKDKTYL